MNVIKVGPFPIPYDRFFLILAVFVIGLIAEIVGRRSKNKPLITWGWNVGFVALLVARVGFVLTHLSDFLPQPLSIFFVWQGGFSLLWGIVGGVACTLWFFRKEPQLLRATLLPVLGVMGVWVISQFVTTSNQAASPQPLPALTLYQLDGTEVALESFKGKPVVVNVWATWCPPCRREMPMLDSVAKANPDVTFLFLDQGEDAAKVQAFFEGIKLEPHNVLLDPGLRFSSSQGMVGYPTTFFYDATGQRVSVKFGELSRAVVTDLLDRIRKSDQPTPSDS
jgi:cytochrome c biogenesis protein CcmG, thiol:disulfide interchange protein DsbE